MKRKTHNYELCGRDGMRCIHCCTLDYELTKEFYELLFQKRRQTFNATIRIFPEDLAKYILSLKEPESNEDNRPWPCPYIGMIDSSPGCMIHPSLHLGLDVRADEKLTGHSCLPTHGCYFHNYLRTPAEKKIFREFMKDAKDWFSYSENLKDSAVFNKQNGYIISRLPLEKVSISSVAEVFNKIHEHLRTELPRKMDCFEEALDMHFPTPTEKYMQDSPLFAAWGFGRVCAKEDLQRTPHFERRLGKEGFAEWGYHGTCEKEMHIYLPIGEILPVDFRDVCITDDASLKEAISIANRTIGDFGRRFG